MQKKPEYFLHGRGCGYKFFEEFEEITRLYPERDLCHLLVKNKTRDVFVCMICNDLFDMLEILLYSCRGAIYLGQDLKLEYISFYDSLGYNCVLEFPANFSEVLKYFKIAYQIIPELDIDRSEKNDLIYEMNYLINRQIKAIYNSFKPAINLQNRANYVLYPQWADIFEKV